MDKVKIGVIGGGGIAGAHVPYLKTLTDQVEVVGVVDVNPEAAKASAERYELSRYATDYNELLPDVDAVLVCAPTAFHADITVACLDAGKAVFSEKPMARTLEQADRMLEAAKRNNKPLQVGFVRRFDDEWLAFRDAIQADKIGKPVVWRNTMASAGPRWSKWFCMDEIGGGPFLDGCIHNIDFALSTFGPAKWAFCHGRTLHAENTAIDTGTATIRFQTGDELMLAWSWGLPVGCNGGTTFEILGPQGTINWPHDEAADAAEKRFVINRGEEGGTSDVSYPANALTRGFQLQMEEFLAVARGEIQPRAGGREGRDSLEVALAILESARSEQVVTIGG